MAASTIAVSIELFNGPIHHHPLDPDGSIPSTHFHNFEHSIMALGFFIYAILLDKLAPPAQHGLATMLRSMAFAMELLVFHAHSTDHMGLEGQYHYLLQVVIFISFSTTLLGINYPHSFLIGFVRSTSVIFQGVWLVNIGFMLWTPGLIPKGFALKRENGYFMVRCHGEGALERAKTLVNIQFSYYFVGLSVVVVIMYLVVFKMYVNKVEYRSPSKGFCLKDEEEGAMKG